MSVLILSPQNFSCDERVKIKPNYTIPQVHYPFLLKLPQNKNIKREPNTFNVKSFARFSQQIPQKNVTVFKFLDDISPDSPIYNFQFLKRGWDGYWAYPFSPQVLSRANNFWQELIKNNFDYPLITPNGNGSIAFTWTHFYPEKELEIWIFDQPSYYAEWLMVKNGKETEGSTSSFLKLLSIFNHYQED